MSGISHFTVKMKKYSDLLEEVKEKIEQHSTVPQAQVDVSQITMNNMGTPTNLMIDEEFNNLRNSYLNNELFNVGDAVITNDGILAEIISRGPNYVTLISEGRQPFKKWLTDIKSTKDKPLKRNQIYKESFTIKGYKTKNFTRELSETFSEISKKFPDSYALYSCVVCLDSLLEVNDKSLSESFRKNKISFERAQNYLNKINLFLPEMKLIEDTFIEHVIMTEGYVRFSMQDKYKAAKLIANAVEYVSNSVDPTELINGAVRKIANMHFSMAGWQTLGKLINIANDSGIPWNKGLLPKQLAARMNLKEN